VLRVTIQLIPDHSWNEPNFKPITLKIMDIKEDGSGSAFEGNYKSRVYENPRAANDWRQKQVLNVPYKEYFPELLVYLALQPWVYDVFRGTASWTNRKKSTPDISDYPVWKATHRDKLIRKEERD
jgi:hypothetical protein